MENNALEASNVDYQKAIELYTMAADRGEVGALFALAQLYAGGKGVNKDYQKAVQYYQKAAALGHKDAPKCLKKIEKLMRKNK